MFRIIRKIASWLANEYGFYRARKAMEIGKLQREKKRANQTVALICEGGR